MSGPKFTPMNALVGSAETTDDGCVGLCRKQQGSDASGRFVVLTDRAYEDLRAAHDIVGASMIGCAAGDTKVPDSVDPGNAGSYRFTNDIRAAIKQAAKLCDDLRKQLATGSGPREPEAIANATLAYRHLEDASMRFGKVLQALDSGVSVYDKATTVGAPAPSALEFGAAVRASGQSGS